MTYQNTAKEPIDQDFRQIVITLSSHISLPCLIDLSVINVADNPIVSFIQNHTVYYLEDSFEFVFLFDAALLTISDEDNSFLSQATVFVTNQPREVVDKLYLLESSNFTILGNGTNEIIVISLEDQLPHQSFIDIVSGISFSSTDQAA